MSAVSKTKLKTYFVTGATPTEAQIGDLIDSSVNTVDNISSALDSESTINVLSSVGAKALKDSLDLMTGRVTKLETNETDALSSYYKKTEVDNFFTTAGNGVSANEASITALQARVKNNEDNKVSLGHVFPSLSAISGLQDLLNAKVQVSIFNSAIATKVSLGHKHSVSDIDGLGEVSLFAKKSDLNAKANTVHGHAVSDINDIKTSFYTKGEVDTKVSIHTHTESQITDLDKYTQAQTNLKILDHTNLKDNPHDVTKAQVSLGNVENLSPVSLFASSASLAYREKILVSLGSQLNGVNVSLFSHKSDTNNPHNVTKGDISLGNVPNIDVKQLLDIHLNEENPHKVSLGSFDVYSRAETDSRVTVGLDSIRYAFKPTSPQESAGSIGDLTWAADSSGNYKAYLKVGENDWRGINLFKEQSDGNVECYFDADFFGNVSIAGNIKVDGSGLIAKVSIAGNEIAATSGNLNFKSNSVFDGTIDVAGCGQISNVSICSSKISTTDDSALTIPNALNVGKDLTVEGNLTVQGTQTILNTQTLDVEDNKITLNKNVTGDPATNSGIVVERGTSQNTELFWDEATDKWKLDIGGVIKTIAFDEDLDAHVADTSNPHSVTKEQVGLGDVSNIAPADLPVSTAVTQEISTQVTNINTTINNTTVLLQGQIDTLVANQYAVDDYA